MRRRQAVACSWSKIGIMYGLLGIFLGCIVLFADGQSDNVTCGGVAMSPDQGCVSSRHGVDTGSSTYGEQEQSQTVIYRLGPWLLVGGVVLLVGSAAAKVRDGRRQR